ncbi:hypothetical protein SAMN05660991_03522 [Trujillonella endophytica]|uniref:Uncharacterized protein n=1 Tax=Trujillonella endophytica TaxID=673521 RepID=A0A1H8VHF5_9ACTN|nr:hypothetical protein SAMN05660991_03522 [Trujillella endophytica]
MVAGDALGPHRAELIVEPGPELLQAHPPTLARPGHRPGTYAGSVITTGSAALDTVLEIGIAVCLLLTLGLLWRNLRDR